MDLTPKTLGDLGEAAALEFLRPLFQDVRLAKPSWPWDIECTGLRREPAVRGSSRPPSETYGDEGLTYFFQVKTGRGYRKGIAVETATLARWIEQVETSPIVVLQIDDPYRPSFSFLALHRWLEEQEVGQRLLTDTCQIAFDEFRDAGEDAAGLMVDLRDEADRADGTASSLFATLKNEYGLVPLNESLLLQVPELASVVEPSIAVSQALRRDGRPIPSVVREVLLARGLPRDPVLHEWARRLRARPRVTPPYAARQLALFYWRIREFRSGRLLHLPPYHVRETSAWRSLAVLYAPDALPYLREVVTNPRSSPQDVLFASAVLPVPTYATDAWASHEASRILEELEARAGRGWTDYASYLFQREMNRSLAEGGRTAHLGTAIDIITDPRAAQYELAHLRAYGWPDETIYWNLERKLLAPAGRDAAIAPFIAAMAQVALPQLPPHLRDPRRTRLP